MERSITNESRRPSQLEQTAEPTPRADTATDHGRAFRAVAIGSMFAGGLLVAGIVGPLAASFAFRSPDPGREPTANDHPPRPTT